MGSLFGKTKQRVTKILEMLMIVGLVKQLEIYFTHVIGKKVNVYKSAKLRQNLCLWID